MVEGVVDVVDDQVPVGVLDRLGRDERARTARRRCPGPRWPWRRWSGWRSPRGCPGRPGRPGCRPRASPGGGCRATGSGPAARRDRAAWSWAFLSSGGPCGGRLPVTGVRALGEQGDGPGGHVLGGEAELLQDHARRGPRPRSGRWRRWRRRSAPTRRRWPPRPPGGGRPRGGPRPGRRRAASANSSHDGNDTTRAPDAGRGQQVGGARGRGGPRCRCRRGRRRAARPPARAST